MSVKELMIGITRDENSSRGLIKVAYAPFDQETINKLLDRGASHLLIAFFNQEGENKIVLGDGLNHDAFKRAVEQNGEVKDWSRGQLYFDENNRAVSLTLRYHFLGDVNKEDNLVSLLSPIESKLLCPSGVKVTCCGCDYLYSPVLKVARRLPFFAGKM